MRILRTWLFFFSLCVASVLAALFLRGGINATVFVAMKAVAADIQSWMTTEDEAQTARIELAAATLPPLQSLDSHHPRKVARSAPRYTAVDHSRQDTQVCSRPQTRSRTDTTEPSIYKWVDASGQTHLSDQPPEKGMASLVNLGETRKDFTYEIMPDGITLPVDFSGQLHAGSKRIYDTWHFFLGEDKLRQSRIKVKLIGGPDRFNAYHAKVSPDSKPVNGFYSMRKNLAVVKFDASDLDRTIATSFHETSHLITASHLGPTPPWLTEGLAEYFETMDVSGQGGLIHPNQGHIQLLRRTKLPSLQSYLNIKRRDWYGEDRDRNYAIAWSLVHFLMSDSSGKYALQKTVQLAHANFCRLFSAVEALGNAYPGGLRQFEAHWRQWLSRGNFQTLQT